MDNEPRIFSEGGSPKPGAWSGAEVALDKPAPLCDRTEIQSLREWMAQWGPEGTPNWADPKGNLLPVSRTTLTRLLDTADYAWERFDELTERDQEQPF
jgi:hypothetical protein